MATLSDLQAAERKMRELLTSEGLPQPDDVEYGEAEVVFRWEEQKLAVAIDVTDDCLELLRDD